MTPIKRGTARALGLRKPEPVFQPQIQGPGLLLGEPSALWLDLQRQIREGHFQIALDMAKFAHWTEGQGEALRAGMQRFVDALTRGQNRP